LDYIDLIHNQEEKLNKESLKTTKSFLLFTLLFI
jgi:hypothetical protein